MIAWVSTMDSPCMYYHVIYTRASTRCRGSEMIVYGSTGSQHIDGVASPSNATNSRDLSLTCTLHIMWVLWVTKHHLWHAVSQGNQTTNSRELVVMVNMMEDNPEGVSLVPLTTYNSRELSVSGTLHNVVPFTPTNTLLNGSSGSRSS